MLVSSDEDEDEHSVTERRGEHEIGRASCRERVSSQV
jgi:hypothetical protein